ncbi:MAG: hypothetical protein R3B95_12180 [Nitrospirales bacterium]|nr:hypothetical protein [Nitrospirales bacterium]
MNNQSARGKNRKDQDSGVWGLLGVAALLGICCAVAPFLAASGMGLMAGLLTGTGAVMTAGLILVMVGSILLYRRLRRHTSLDRHRCCAPRKENQR